MANATSPLCNHLTTMAAVLEQNSSTATESPLIAMRVLQGEDVCKGGNHALLWLGRGQWRYSIEQPGQL